MPNVIIGTPTSPSIIMSTDRGSPRQVLSQLVGIITNGLTLQLDASNSLSYVVVGQLGMI